MLKSLWLDRASRFACVLPIPYVQAAILNLLNPYIRSCYALRDIIHVVTCTCIQHTHLCGYITILYVRLQSIHVQEFDIHSCTSHYHFKGQHTCILRNLYMYTVHLTIYSNTSRRGETCFSTHFLEHTSYSKEYEKYTNFITGLRVRCFFAHYTCIFLFKPMGILLKVAQHDQTSYTYVHVEHLMLLIHPIILALVDPRVNRN